MGTAAETIELHTRRATLTPSSIDKDKRTFSGICSTGAPRRMLDFLGPFTERLSLDPKHAHVKGLKGASILDTHQRRELRNVLGVVTDVGIANGECWFDGKFSSRPEAEPFWQDLCDGILRFFSIGYVVDEYKETKDPKTGERTLTAVDWTPHEISLVPLPADAGATVRNKQMTESTIEETAEAARAAPIPREVRDQVLSEERTRVKEIRLRTRAAKLPDDVAEQLIDDGVALPHVAERLLDELYERGAQRPISRIRVGESHDGPDEVMERMQEGLYCRLTGAKPSDAARQYRSVSFLNLCAMRLEQRGERGVRFLSADQILQRMHTTSDFPTLLTGTGNRMLMAAFQAAPNALKSLARPTTIDDFRAKTVAKLGPISALQKVSEAGEVKNVSRSEAKESYSLETFGGIFSMSRKALVNDDLSAFSDWTAAAGRSASETEATQLLALLTANSNAGVTMDDGQPLFHTTRNNLAASGTAISTASLGAGRLAMRAQTDVGSTMLIDSAPKFLLVGPAKETEAETVLATLYPATTATVNPFQGKFELVVEPRLAGNGWFLVASPESAPVFEFAYLTSAPGPQLATREGWDVLGAEFRVILDWACDAIDHRGIYRNPGN